MRSSILLALFASACSVSATTSQPRRSYETHDYYALHLDSQTSPSELAQHLGLQHEGPLGPLDDHHVFSAPKHNNDIIEDSIQELKRRRRRKRDATSEPHILDGVLLNQKQVLRKRLVKRSIIPPLEKRAAQNEQAVAVRAQVAKSLSIVDPIFNDQWHVYNTVEVGHDLNVTGVWEMGITGKNATVCIIDDGLDMDSLDLKPNYFAKGSYDFNDQVAEPKPRLSDDQHGTRCAGEVAAAKNDVCGVGLAYDSRISGVRILSKPITDIDEAESIIYAYNDNDIFSCSWGPPDDGRTMDAPGILIKRAMLKGVQEGRHGKGLIYVFAAGNGAGYDDNCNFDGYTNSILSITVGAIDKTDAHPYYSEACSAILTVTYSSGAGEAIHTTDVGVNKCSTVHGGTSAAGPLAAGVYALALSARPELTWRDMQWITVMTSVPFYNEEKESDWQTTGAGRKYSHQHGYGKLNAYAVVEAAKTWTLVKPQAWYVTPWIHVKHEIPQGDQGLHSTFTITKQMMENSNLERVEHVTVTMNVEHTRRGDLSVELRSPTGLVSHLSTARKSDEAAEGYVDWTFMSVVHFGETGEGEWTIIVKDTIENDHSGNFTDWKLQLYGESLDPRRATLLPMPEENDDVDHDVIATTGLVSTASIALPTSTADLGDPATHPTRPAISKPPGEAVPTSNPLTAVPTGTVPFEAPITATPTSTSAPSADTDTDKDESGQDNFLPSLFPTFGVSKRTQIWIYGALAIILIFVSGLLTYFFVQRRKRLRNAGRDDYEFEMLDDQEEEQGLTSGVRGAGVGGKKKSRRAGELYDAFAGESDEEFFSEDEEEAGRPYRDEDEEEWREKDGEHSDT
jgi:kexin